MTKNHAMRIKVRAKDARSRGALSYLYKTPDDLLYKMPVIERYLAKRGFCVEYRDYAPCDNPRCAQMHTTVAISW